MKTMGMFRSRFTGASSVVAALILAGCASGVKLDNAAPVETRTPANSSAGTGADANATSQSQVTGVDLSKNDADAGSKLPRVIYFDFDSFVVKDEYRSLVESHSKVLTADRKKHMTIEGHTDDRGGREYNLALGQKRAEAVLKSLELLGAADNQLEAVSFGKERPAVQGNDEAAWAKNRRAELAYR